MTKTEHYQLNQWEASDRVLREDFNSDNAKIDAAIESVRTAALQLFVGSYTGDGTADRTIDLGRAPKAVYVCAENGQILSSGRYYGGLAVPGHPVWIENPQLTVLEVCSTGFIVHYRYNDPYKTYAYSNAENVNYHYLALC